MWLRLHSFMERSRANGPGLRAVVWTQGCSLGCPGCFNPETHVREAGHWVRVDDLMGQIRELPPEIEGITISGGEPLQQFDAVLFLLQRIRRESRFSVLIFTGFTPDEVQRFPKFEELLTCVDVLIAGRYDQSQRLARGLIASANKQALLLTDRYTRADLHAVPEAELIVQPDGSISISGIDPLTIT
jgi:anaerobic ribonucleoside-triphosphate reductase activating protein